MFSGLAHAESHAFLGTFHSRNSWLSLSLSLSKFQAAFPQRFTIRSSAVPYYSQHFSVALSEGYVLSLYYARHTY